MNIFNFWSWPLEVIEDIRQWSIVNKALKEPQTIEELKRFEYELRIDSIGRIYTVINVPEELYPYEMKDQVWPWVLEKLRDLDSILMNVRLNDLFYPEVNKLENYPAYLVVLSPSTESLKLSKFIEWIFKSTFTFLTAFLVNKIFHKIVGTSIFDYVLNLI